MKTGSNIRLRADGRYEARYQKGRNEQGRIIYGYCYGKTYEEAEAKRYIATKEIQSMHAVKRMNLLILGAGGQGQVVKEIAESIGVFHKVDFLDDNPENKLAIGKCSDCAKFIDKYPIAIPSVGNRDLRISWIDMLVNEGFVLPTLIHRTAIVSPSASVDYGTVIEAKVTVGAGSKIGYGCIISSGATVDRNVEIADGTHVGCGEIITRMD